jgi:NAD(P)-dependent dehydrogenase (short-subunit alcohol dehydrogenase family)
MADSRVILITGVTRGLGRALAVRFAELGHTIAGCGRSAGPLDELRRALGPRHHFQTVDVVDDAAVAAWATTVEDTVGLPDLLLNNAALINHRAPLWEVPADEFSSVLDVNVKGVVNVLRHFVPRMIARGSGVICNISSGWGQFSAPLVGPYCATKFAIEGLTGSLALELPSGMAAIPLQPGIIHTEMLDEAFGEGATQHWRPEQWIDVAAPFILGLGPQDNGKRLRIPDA